MFEGNVWRSVWRICIWILGLKGLSDNKDDSKENGEKAIGLYQQNNFACVSRIFVHFLAAIT